MAQTPQEEPADLRNPPLFLVEHAGSRVFLLGSIHALPAESVPLPPQVEAAYAAADLVAFEADLLSVDPVALLDTATNDALVEDLLTADQRVRLDSAMVALGLPIGSLPALEPWLAALTFSMISVTAGLEGAGLGEGVDAILTARAIADGKTRAALETVEEQFATLDDLPSDVQVAFLLETLSMSPEASAAELLAIIEAWNTGDDKAIARFVGEGSGMAPEIRKALLDDRNHAWLPAILGFLDRPGHTSLVVVGAGHLVGEGSVVALLRAAGHTVTRL